jgi:hypothetical protein
MRVVAFHMPQRIENERCVYFSASVIERERASARSMAVTPRCSTRFSSKSLGLPVGMKPSTRTTPSTTPAACPSSRPRQPEAASAA